MTTFRLGLDLDVECARCKRARPAPERERARLIASGERLTIIAADEPCACGEHRVAVRPRVTTRK